MFFGAGASGAGCALAARAALREAGVGEADLSPRVLCLDSKGLILRDRPGSKARRTIAADPRWFGMGRGPPDAIHLAEVVERFHPDDPDRRVRAAGRLHRADRPRDARGCPRPIILPISNPTAKAEATPADILAWTGGAAVVGTGSPFPPVTIDGVTHEIGQGNNAFIFPGVGLGAIAVGASRLTDRAFAAAGDAVHITRTSRSTPARSPPPGAAEPRSTSRPRGSRSPTRPTSSATWPNAAPTASSSATPAGLAFCAEHGIPFVADFSLNAANQLTVDSPAEPRRAAGHGLVRPERRPAPRPAATPFRPPGSRS